MVHFRSRGCARSGARRYTGNCGPVYGGFTDALTRPISKRQTRCWKRSIDADARLGHQRSFSLWVAEQDQHQRIELKPAVTRRLRVIDARETPWRRPAAGRREVINGFRHRILARPCHEPVPRGAGRGHGERRQQSGKNDPTMHPLFFVLSRTRRSRRTSQGALLETKRVPLPCLLGSGLYQGMFIIPDFPDEQRVS